MQARSKQAAPEAPKPTRSLLKWAGGKSRLAPLIASKLPERIDTFYEPFVGSAAVFFYLAAAGRFRRAVLGDNNAALIDVYRAVQKDVAALTRALQQARFTTLGEDAYYEVRALDPSKLDLFQRAARTLYLNRTGYNGLYRVNKSGDYNVPFGRYKRPRIYYPERLAAAARALSGVKLEVADFEQVTQQAGAGDAVYFDPPYVPLSRSSSFTAYSKGAFGAAEHERLSRVFAGLAERRVCAVLSNSDTPLTRELYAPWQLERLVVARPINSNAAKRGGVGELLVTNTRAKPAPRAKRTSD